MGELSELISVTVASEFEQIGTEINMKYEEFASSVDKTITTAALITELKSTKTSMNQNTSFYLCFIFLYLYPLIIKPYQR